MIKIIITFLLLPLLIYNSISFGQKIDLSEWEYKKNILIDNTSNSNSIINHPFRIILDPTYIDFSLAKPDGDDILFVDSDGETLLSFWIESWSPPTAEVFVKIPEVVANSEKIICLFYGNPNANATSNGKTTFTFFDSFERFNDPQKNAITPQTTPTYDGSGQAVHPDIVYVPEEWNGYKYWMVLTPYPGSDDSYENPSIIVSDDGISWIEPSGISNPLVPEPDGWNNDTDMILVDSVMSLYFNETNNNKTTYVKRMTSLNGVDWATPEIVFSVPWHIMSPTIIYEDGTYFMWYARSSDGCWSNFQNITMRTSSDGIIWGNEVTVNIPIDGRVVWHQDVIKVGNKYVMILASYSKNSDCLHTSLFYAESTDKINWSVSNSPIIITPNSSTAWDNREIYRSTFLMENDFLRIWYSAVNESDVWHIGYTEDDLPNFLDKIFWNKREGGLIASNDFVHTGEYSLKEYFGESSTPKVFKSISKKGSYNVWLYDEMNTEIGHQAIFRLTDLRTDHSTDINTKNIGLGISQDESSAEYVYHYDNLIYQTTNVLRSEGWHKLTFLVEDNYSELYIDDEFITSLNDLDESYLTRLSLEGGTSGNSWFDDVYWHEQLDVTPDISHLSYPKIITPIKDEVKGEDFLSHVVAKLDSIFDNSDTSNPLSYNASDKNEHMYLWIDDDNKLWSEPEQNYFGIDSIVVSATNQYGFFTTDTFLLITKPINDPPILTEMPDIFLNEDDTVCVYLNPFVTDIDSDTSDIRFIVSLLNSDNNNFQSSSRLQKEKSKFILGNNELLITINNTNNSAEISAEPDSAGIFQVLFTAIDDSLATDSDTVIVNVLSVNDFPSITGLPDTLFTTRDSTLELKIWNYVSDKETPDSLLQYKFLIEDSELSIDFNKENGILTIDVIEEFIGTSNLFIAITDDSSSVVRDTIVVDVDEVTGIKNRSKNNLPSKYSLSQNYPNPFNPSTTISFDLPFKSKVILDIYNLLGQNVLEVMNDDFEGGSYSVNINASELTSGVYIYIFTATDLQNKVFINSRKMILLK